jgi:hypothetical protein
MAQPTAYNRVASFTNLQAAAPADPPPGATLDAEFNAVKATIDEILANIELIQRDDGALANESVGLDQLSEDIEVGWQAPEVWVTATDYVVGNTVFRGSAFYRCLVDHTAGTFTTDLSAGKWEEIVDLSDLQIVAASQIAVTPTGGIASTNVQTALAELDSEKAALSHTHLASAISNSTTAGRNMLTAANVAAQQSLLGLGDLAYLDDLDTDVIPANLALTGDISPSVLSSSQNDWSPTGWAGASTVKLSANTSINITGFLATTDGDLKLLHNVGTKPITITASDTASVAANRVIAPGPIVVLPNADAVLQYDGTSSTVGWRQVSRTPATPAFQCQLTKSSSNLLLSRFGGMFLWINGANQLVPAAGVTLASPATNGTLYYIYAYMSSGAMALEASATAYAVDSDYGHLIKSGDATRTLVGMARTVSSAWVDSAAQRFVRSYFNDPGIAVLSSYTANRSTTSTNYAEVNTEIRVEFLTWTGETILTSANGSVDLNSAAYVSASIGFNGTTAEDTFVNCYVGLNNGYVPFNVCVFKTGLTEGYNYATLLGKVSGNTGTFLGGSSGERTTLRAMTQR